MGEVISLNFRPKNIHTEFKESHFKGGHICIHCGSLIVVKNGKSNGKQRYKWKDCNRPFNDLAFFLGMSIRKSAEKDVLFKARKF